MIDADAIFNLLCEEGTPRMEAQFIADMGCHATEEAFKAMIRVVESCPPEARSRVAICALTLIETRIQMARRETLGQ